MKMILVFIVFHLNKSFHIFLLAELYFNQVGTCKSFEVFYHMQSDIMISTLDKCDSAHFKIYFFLRNYIKNFNFRYFLFHYLTC